MEKLKVKIVHGLGQRPTKAYPHDAGWDLYPLETMELLPGHQALISTGIAIAIPQGYYGRIAERSGLGSRGLGVGAGVIDSGYRGEIKIAVYNRALHAKEGILIERSTPIAQIIIERCDLFELEEVGELPPSVRGVLGFGSSS